MDIHHFFLGHARLSRKSLARFAELDADEIDGIADGLGLGGLLTLQEAKAVLSDLGDQTAEDDGPEDGEDEDDGDDPDAEDGGDGEEDEDDDEPEEEE